MENNKEKKIGEKITKESISELLKGYKERYSFNVRSIGIVEERSGGTTKTGKELKLSYISWSYAELIGNLLDENFSWRLIEYQEDGAVIEMTLLGKTRTHKYPYLDNMNKPIENPNGFDKNNAQMRGMSKLFSIMSGVGLGLYTGEDLPVKIEGGSNGFNRKEFIEKLKKHPKTNEILSIYNGIAKENKQKETNDWEYARNDILTILKEKLENKDKPENKEQ